MITTQGHNEYLEPQMQCTQQHRTRRNSINITIEENALQRKFNARGILIICCI